MAKTDTPEEQIAILTKALASERTNHHATEVKLKAADTRIAEQNALGVAPDALHVSKHISDAVAAGTAHATNELQLKVTDLELKLITANAAVTDAGVKLTSRTISEEIRQACRDSHIKPEAVNDVLTIGQGELQLVDGKVQTSEGISLSDWVEQRKASSPYWWPVSRGAGSRGNDAMPGAGAANPWSKETWNLTAQGNLIKSDSAAAERMKASAVT
jgi:hypothetical protein